MASAKLGSDWGDDLRRRLGEVFEYYSQAEVSRRTGIPQSSLSKYASGQRIPADVCSRLVDQLGVQSEWLLTGRGPRFVSELTPDDEDLASSLLRILRAAQESSEHVSRAEHPRTADLEQILHAVAEHEKSQDRLDEVMARLYKRVTDAFERDLQEETKNAAKSYHPVCDLISRFCRDTHLRLYALDMLAYCQRDQGDWHAALETRRRIFRESLALDFDLPEQTVARASNLLVSLKMCGYIQEAIRKSKMLRELYREEQEELYWVAELALGVLELDSDAVDAGLARLDNVLRHVRPQFVELHQQFIAYGQALQGRRTVVEAIEVERARVADLSERARTASGALLAWLVVLAESRDALQAFMTAYGRDVFDRIPPDNRIIRYFPRLESVLLGIGADVHEYWESQRDQSHPLAEAEVAILATQFARLTRHSGARAYFDRAQERIDALESGQEIRLVLAALHARNALALLPNAPKNEPDRSWRSRALTRLRTLVDSGCAMANEAIPPADRR